MSIKNRLPLLDTKMSEVLTSKLSYAATALARGVPPATNVHIKPNERNIQSQPSPGSKTTPRLLVILMSNM